jgi:anaerobic selenocysteine-containing dehydrogenase
MGYDEPWLHESAEAAIRGVLDATRTRNPYLEGITLERLQAEGTVPLHFTEETHVPFADGHFPTPSGKVELRCEAMRAYGVDPLPDFRLPSEFAGDQRPTTKDQRPRTKDRGWNGNGHRHEEQEAQDLVFGPSSLVLISGASHHFVSSSLANQPSLRAKAGEPFVEINPEDARARGIANGDTVTVLNERGSCQLRAVVTEDVPPGVAVAPKGSWASLSPDGRNINWTTSDALADLAGQSTFHSNLVEVRLV